jgi:hypothetical protein
VTGALTDAVWIFAAFLVLIVAAAVVLASRRFLLERSGGTVECALRRPAAVGPWRLGLLSYQRDELYWYGALGVLLRPEQVFSRRALMVVSRRPAALAETSDLGADRVVVEVAVKPPTDASGSEAGEHLELAMSDSALTGFLAWLEASPPGSHLEDFALRARFDLDRQSQDQNLGRGAGAMGQIPAGTPSEGQRRISPPPPARRPVTNPQFKGARSRSRPKVKISVVLNGPLASAAQAQGIVVREYAAGRAPAARAARPHHPR